MQKNNDHPVYFSILQMQQNNDHQVYFCILKNTKIYLVIIILLHLQNTNKYTWRSLFFCIFKIQINILGDIIILLYLQNTNNIFEQIIILYIFRMRIIYLKK